MLHVALPSRNVLDLALNATPNIYEDSGLPTHDSRHLSKAALIYLS